MSRSRLALLVVIAAAIGAFFAFDLDRFLTLEALKAGRAALAGWVEANFVLALVGYFAVYVAVTGLSLPGAAIMTLAGGALFGLVTGSIVVSFASSVGATLAFLASRFLFRDAVRAKFGQRLAAIDEGVRRDGAFYLFTLRLVPAFPFFLVNLLMGLTPIRTVTYYVVSQLGMLPATVVFVYAGTQLAQLESLSGILSPGLLGAFAAIGVLPLLMRFVANALAARRIYRGHRKPPRFDYNLVVVGAGSAGLVSAYIGAAVKAKVALVERHKMGGDCLNTGCVPSKALIRATRLLAEARDSSKLGIRRVEATFDFAEVMERVQKVVAAVEPHDSVERYTGLGVDCIQGAARLVSPWEVEVDGRRISARSIIIATGARPLVPKLPGLDGIAYLTSDTLWDLRVQPRRLLVLGGGPIGCELALAFARLGSRVTQVEMAPRLLPREDEDVSALLAKVFAHEGVDVRCGHRAVRVEPAADGIGGALVAEGPGGEVRLDFDRLLLALGRTANVSGFGLEELGVRIGPRGTIEADPLLRTNFPNIAVCGDVTGPYQFTHVSAHQAWYAAVNQLLAPFWSFRVDYRVIPWATFTDPQVARVGLSEAEATAQGIAHEVTRYGIDDLDRAIADGTAEGFVKVLTAPGKDTILGATIVHAEAGELIAEYVMAMKHGLGMNRILGTIHAYPTLMEANKYAAGNWKRAHAPQAALRWAQRFFAWRRG
ncbi:MAG: FAD-dependent oxidoreductase [Xanthomonadaceae bacterium]|nr:FAD-dependent oxidoreductase [Xanthomonadaceae bacterium]